MTSLGFTKSKVNPNLYMKVMDDEPVILLLYVDDLFLTGNGKHITESKKKLVEATRRIQDEISWIDALFTRVGSVEIPEGIFMNKGKYAV